MTGITPPTGTEPVGDEVKMVRFLGTMIESSSETSLGAFNNSNNGRTMLHRFEIDNHGAEISPLRHFSADNRRTAERAHIHVFS